MRLLIHEFMTAGGASEGGLSPKLVHEGRRMVDALLDDALCLPGLRITVARHSSVPGFRAGVDEFVVDEHGDPLAAFEAALKRVDAVWPIAPETDGWLGRFAGHARGARRRVIAASDAAITIASSKHETTRRLQAAGVPVVPIWTPAQVPADADASAWWVLKPDDGAGADRTFRLRSAEAIARAGSAGERAVLGPWVDGEALSISALGDAGGTEVLSVNRQRIAICPDGRVALKGVETAIAVPERSRASFAALTADVARAVPGLVGYFGIDLVATPDGRLHVVEINPRLTLAYEGLSRAIGRNVAQSVLAACGGYGAIR